MALRKWLQRYWFLLGLVVITGITLADQQEWTVRIGRWLKAHHGPDTVIFAIFFLSGLALDSRMLRKGLGDLKATLAALVVIFILAPLLARGFQYLPLDTQIITGLVLVAVMPSTLSSGVVMTGAAGGNMAHALFITIVANSLAVLSIPLVLSWLLAAQGMDKTITIDKTAMMLKIALLVLLPLVLGMALQWIGRRWIAPVAYRVQVLNQLLILMIVWMGICQSRDAIVSGGQAVGPIAAVAFGYHFLLVACALLTVKLTGIGPGRRESVIFMGGQKTLPLSVILQVTLFPTFGLALVVCVLHHIIHLIMDAYLVERLKGKGRASL
ncbi:MAG: bile acid:sodium symporter [Desulfobacteraceae bacterium]